MEKKVFIERRGKGSPGKPSFKNLTSEQKLKKAEVRIPFLEAKVAFQKKLDELEWQASQKKNR